MGLTGWILPADLGAGSAWMREWVIHVYMQVGMLFTRVTFAERKDDKVSTCAPSLLLPSSTRFGRTMNGIPCILNGMSVYEGNHIHFYYLLSLITLKRCDEFGKTTTKLSR